MTIGGWLWKSQKQLDQTGVGTARLDCLVLLEDILSKNRTHLLAHPEIELSTEQEEVLNSWIKRRSAHEPLAYIRNKTEFYGRSFYIDKRVLEPRPESEMMIDLLKLLPIKPNTIIADIGTGSGALAITAKLELPQSTIFASDLDKSCLHVARKNAKLLNASINFLEGSLLEPYVQKHISPDTLLCNLPYVPDGFPINVAATHEPHIAIFGGSDGLQLYRQLFSHVQFLKPQPSHILTEALPRQQIELSSIAHAAGYRAANDADDFIQLFTRIG